MVTNAESVILCESDGTYSIKTFVRFDDIRT